MTLNRNVNLHRRKRHVCRINHSLCHAAQSSEEIVRESVAVDEKGRVAGEVELDIHEGVHHLAII